ncbi:hypothetical protein ACOSQ4_006176 [Xanthoceras sorbifolium]
MVLEPKPGFELRGKEVASSHHRSLLVLTIFLSFHGKPAPLFSPLRHCCPPQFHRIRSTALQLSLSLSLFKSVKTLMPEIDAFRVSRRVSCKIGSRFC